MSHWVDSPAQMQVSRIRAFDLARGLAVLFMVWVHVLDFYSLESVKQGWFGYFVGLFGTLPAAPVFMFIMGALIAFSDHGNVSKNLKRAGGLLLMGYALNFFRGSLPKWLSLEMGWATPEQIGQYTPLAELLIVDILQFAALAFAVCSLLCAFMPKPKIWLALALIVVFISPELWGAYTGIFFVDRVLDLFWGTKAFGVMFPLFPWLVFPLVGMAFGYWLKHTDDPAVIFKRGLWAGLLVAFLGGAWTLTDFEFHTGDYYRSGPGFVMFMSGFALVWLWLCRWITERCKDRGLLRLLSFWSRQVTVFYVMQWLVIGWALLAIGSETLTITSTLIAMLAVLVVSDLLTRAWVRLKRQYLNKPKTLTNETDQQGSVSSHS